MGGLGGRKMFKDCLVALYPGYFLYEKEPGYEVNCLGDRPHVSCVPMSLT